jgi:hypothetical protein
MSLSLLIALQMGSADVTGQWSSYVLGQRWDFTVLRRDLERTPLWADSDETPPLAPRRAIAVARSELERLVPAADAWRLSNVQLRPVHGPGRWIYLVGFDEPAPGPMGGIGQTLEIVVLMNGVAVQPTPHAVAGGKMNCGTAICRASVVSPGSIPTDQTSQHERCEASTSWLHARRVIRVVVSS